MVKRISPFTILKKGYVEAIWIKRMKRGPMDRVEEIEAIAGLGLKGNADQGGRRQVTLLGQESWEVVMREVQGTAPPSARRANILVRGVTLARSRNRILLVGACRIRVLGETKPCERMEDVWPGLQTEMSKDWHGGAFGEILDNGRIAVGDVVKWLI